MSTAVVLGGGISGLSAAYYLSKHGLDVFKRIILLESSSRLGGWIQTTHFDDGTVFEQGPRSLRGTGRPAKSTLKLADELGLRKDIISVTSKSPAARNRFVYCRGTIHKLPNSMLTMMKRTPPLSRPLVSNLLKELFTKPSQNEHDESIHSFISRRLGAEVADFLIDPVCRGIYAGNARELSVKACFPDIFRWEQQHGGIIKGALRSPRDRTDYHSELVSLSKAERWAMWSMTEGMQALPMRLARMMESGVEVKTGAPCSMLDFDEASGRARVYCGQSVIEADHVFSGLSSKCLSQLLPSNHLTLADKLSDIKFATVCVANVEYRDKASLQGFGHLVPSSEPSKALGIIYDSSNFPNHDNKEFPSQRYTVMLGGAWFEEMFGDPDKVAMETLEEETLHTMRVQMNLIQEPTKLIAQLNKDCIPQYRLGHTDLVQGLFSYVKEKHLPLSLIGASYKGVSVNDCILNAKLEVARVLGRQID